MDNGQAAVFALVPDMGRAKEGMRITRGGIQRVLHGLGETERASETFWYLYGVYGDSRGYFTVDCPYATWYLSSKVEENHPIFPSRQLLD